VKIAVHMADGRTIHVLERRADLIELCTRKPHEIDRARPIACLTKFHRDGSFESSRLLYLRAASISQITPFELANV